MIDPVSLTIGIIAILTAILTHIKYSQCCGFRVQTRTPEGQTQQPTFNLPPRTRLFGITE